jgi:hypothetical protein
VHATQNAHPITQGMKPFIVNDEQQYVDYDKDPRYIILESENLDGLTYPGRGIVAGDPLAIVTLEVRCKADNLRNG